MHSPAERTRGHFYAFTGIEPERASQGFIERRASLDQRFLSAV
jgi:hypothetical protein